MIDNIKRFVNEHHTLMVVIIGVLVICFLYWWFCCKDRPLGDKVKGGFVGFRFFQVNGSIHKFIGMDFIDNVIPFYVLSDVGEQWFTDNGIFSEQTFAYFNSFTKILKSMCTSPVNFITGESGKKGKSIHRVSTTKFIDTIINNNNAIPACAGTRVNNTKFHFTKCFTKRDYKHLPEMYNRMAAVINEKAGNFVNKVLFIGQGARQPYTENAVSEQNYRFSENLTDEVDDSIKGLYEICKSHIRKWYGGKKMDLIIKDGYYDSQNGDIAKKDNVVHPDGTIEKDMDGNNWEVADIFPARKVIMMVFLLISLYSKCYKDINRNDYFQMVASYILHVHLFNTCCAVRMTRNWNHDIGNSYVYIYDVNGQPQGNCNITMEEVKFAQAFFDGDRIKDLNKAELNDFLEGLGKDGRQNMRQGLDEISPPETQNTEDFISDDETDDEDDDENLKAEVMSNPSTIKIKKKTAKERSHQLEAENTRDVVDFVRKCFSTI